MAQYEPFDCAACGEKHNYGLLDGYLIAERVLDRVLFECRHDASADVWDVEVHDSSVPFLRQNFIPAQVAVWVHAIQRLCKNHDIWTCPECGGDTFPVSHRQPAALPQPKRLPLAKPPHQGRKGFKSGGADAGQS